MPEGATRTGMALPSMTFAAVLIVSSSLLTDAFATFHEHRIAPATSEGPGLYTRTIRASPSSDCFNALRTRLSGATLKNEPAAGSASLFFLRTDRNGR